MKKKSMSLLAVTLIVGGLLCGCNAEKSAYNKGVKAQEEQNYEDAIEYYKEAGDYEDAKDKIEECEHLNDIANDTTAPSISGLEEKIDIKCATEYNINDYIQENIKIEDDVTEGIVDYSISGDDLYDRGTGIIDTSKVGEYEISVTAEDEAGNTGEAKITLNIEPVVVSKKHRTPTIYDGEYGTIKLKKFGHGDPYENSDTYGYYALFEVTNKYDKNVYVGWSNSTSVNDYQVGAVYEVTAIAPGKKGRALTFFEDKDIPEDAGNFSQIDSAVTMWDGDTEEALVSISTTFNTDALK